MIGEELLGVVIGAGLIFLYLGIRAWILERPMRRKR